MWTKAEFDQTFLKFFIFMRKKRSKRVFRKWILKNGYLKKRLKKTVFNLVLAYFGSLLWPPIWFLIDKIALRSK